MGSPGFFRGLKGLSVTWFMVTVEMQMFILLQAFSVNASVAAVVSFVLAGLAIIANMIVYWFDKNIN